jgi:DNA-binding NarL/FixJ family response regulator
MPTLAVLHETIQAQLQGQQTPDARYLKLACAAPTLERLRAALALSPAQVLVLDLALLGSPDDPQSLIQTLQQLRNDTSPEEVVIIYAYATRATLQALESADVKLLRAPVSLSLLRSSLMSLIARELFGRDTSSHYPPRVPLSHTVEDTLRSLTNLSLAASQSTHAFTDPSIRVLAQQADLAHDAIDRAARAITDARPRE